MAPGMAGDATGEYSHCLNRQTLSPCYTRFAVVNAPRRWLLRVMPAGDSRPR